MVTKLYLCIPKKTYQGRTDPSWDGSMVTKFSSGTVTQKTLPTADSLKLDDDDGHDHII